MMEAEGFRESLHPTLIVNCVANALLSFTAIVLNVITIQALRKTPFVVADFEIIATKLDYF